MDWDRLDTLDDFSEEDELWEMRFARVKKMASSHTATDNEKFNVFREALNDEEPAVRYAAVVGLHGLTGENVADAFIYALSDSYEWVRIRAIEGLGKIKAKKAIDIFIRYLETEPDPKVRATFVKHLGSFYEERLVPVIAGYLQDGDARVRANAIEGLGHFPKENVLHILEPFVDDENVRIRANVAVILSRFEVPLAKETINKMVASSDPYQRVGAIYSLGELKNEDHVPLLFRHLTDPSYLVQKNAREALVKFGTKIQGTLLKEIRNSSNSVFVQGAVQVLGEIGDRKALKTLMRLREAGDGEIRQYVEEAVDKIVERTS
jgi:HEAT repeat protein